MKTVEFVEDDYISRMAVPTPYLEFQGSNIYPPAYSGDAGYDLAAKGLHVISPGDIIWVSTGVRINCPEPFWCMITARSSLHKKGAIVPLGVIDAGYQGELLVPVLSLGNIFSIQDGERIAQVIFFQQTLPRLFLTKTFTPSARGTNGFGSTTSGSTGQRKSNRTAARGTTRPARSRKSKTRSR